MEAGLQTVNKLLLTVLGQPKGDLVFLQKPIIQVCQFSFLMTGREGKTPHLMLFYPTLAIKLNCFV